MNGPISISTDQHAAVRYNLGNNAGSVPSSMIALCCGRTTVIDRVSHFEKATAVRPSLGSKGAVDLGDGCCLGDSFNGNFTNLILAFLAKCSGPGRSVPSKSGSMRGWRPVQSLQGDSPLKKVKALQVRFLPITGA